MLSTEAVAVLAGGLTLLALFRLRRNLRDARAPLQIERPWRRLLAAGAPHGPAADAVRRVPGPCVPCATALQDCPHGDPARLVASGYTRQDAGASDPLVFSVWQGPEGDRIVLSASEGAPLRLGNDTG